MKRLAPNIPEPVATKVVLSECCALATVATPVEIVTTEDSALLLPSASSEAGLKEHFECEGRPLQLRVIEPLKPFDGMRVTLFVAALLCPTVKEAAEVDTAKSAFPITENDACAEVRPLLLAVIV